MSSRNVEPKLDLVPIMNMVTILIPFLLLSAEFVSFSVVDVSLPGTVTTKPSDTPSFALTVTVTSEALVVLGTDGAVTEDAATTLRLPCDGPCALKGYPLRDLQDALYVVKGLHPKVEAVTLAAEDHIHTETLVDVMDAARSHPGHVQDGRAMELFPAVTLASP